MTAEEWQVSESPVAMFAHLDADGYERKVLLYASALCALRPHLLTQSLHDWHAAVESVLRGSAKPHSLDYWQDAAESDSLRLVERGSPDDRAYFSVLSHVVLCTWINDPQELDTPPPDIPEVLPWRRFGASIIRDIFGTQFHPVIFSPEWRTTTVIALAQQMYGSRDFSAMPILADALQDAGCDNEDILQHCRDEKARHVRGCWVVDSVLRKE
jgi:hypothetical protein